MYALPRSLLWLAAATIFSGTAALPLAHSGEAAPSVHAPFADIRVTGRVIAEETERPITGAQVFLRGSSIGVLTDADGQFLLTVPETTAAGGNLTVVVQMIGYGTQEVEIVVDADLHRDYDVEFRLVAQALTLESIIVAGAASGDRTAPAAAPAADAPPAVAAPESAPVVRPGVTRSVAPSSAFRPATERAAPHPAAVGDRRLRADAGGEQYAHIDENGFRRVSDEPLSTLSTDVDRASYSNVRRFLLDERRLPPVDAVQIEEMINYFSYDYEMPRGDDPVGITTEVGVAPWAPGHRLLRIGLATRPVMAEELPPSNLVFLVDVSGSMSSADKLPLVKRSLRLLVDQLRPEDRVALVVYAGAAGLALEPTSGRHRTRILRAIDRLEAGGSTAGGEGLRLAYRVAREAFRRDGNNRVILATDGDFNVGESSDAAMVRLVEEERDDGIFLTVLGFGTGNLQFEKMQTLAQHGNGSHAYIDSMDEARKMFVSELGGTLLTVAKDVKVQVEFNPALVAQYRLIGYENRLLAARDFNDDRKDAGDLGAGHRVTALYEIVPVDVEPVRAGGVDPLRYQRSSLRSDRATAEEIAFVRVRYKRPDGDRSRLLERAVRQTDADEVSCDFHFATAVAGFGMLLRDSEHRGSITSRQVLALASDGLGPDLDGTRQGFLELVRAYRELEGGTRRGPIR